MFVCASACASVSVRARLDPFDGRQIDMHVGLIVRYKQYNESDNTSFDVKDEKTNSEYGFSSDLPSILTFQCFNRLDLTGRSMMLDVLSYEI